jgi:hypothetical protein
MSLAPTKRPLSSDNQKQSSRRKAAIEEKGGGVLSLGDCRSPITDVNMTFIRNDLAICQELSVGFGQERDF